MCRKLVYLFSFVLVAGLVGGVASADPLHQDPGPDGIVSVEAEHFDENVPLSGAEWVEVGPTEGFTGTAGMQVLGPSFYDPGYAATSPRLEYEINFVKTGTHYVWILAWAASGSDDSCHVGLDGEETPLSSNWSGGGNTWSNDRYPETGREQFEVTTTGIHVLNIWVREDGLIVDKIVLTTNPDYTPTGDGPPESHRGPVLNAFNPSPAEGEIYLDTWASLAWSAGATAASHDVYFSDNFDDVNDGTPDSSGFQGNQPSTFLVVGFPGFAYPDGLVPGTTYYWRVDEIEVDGTTIHKGIVWSFWIPPKKAYDPEPADGTPFIDPNAILSWTAGFGTKLHHVYFSDNFDDVNSGVVGIPQGTTDYTPGPLEHNKVYYWRVDEFDGLNTYKGDVWSFKTAKVGGGMRGDYYRGMNFENLVMTRIDPRIDFNWGDPGSPDASVGDDNFSARWTGEVEAAFTETYTFYTNSDDGVRLWVDGQELVDDWEDQSATENFGTIDLVAGNVYGLLMEYYENSGGAVAELWWSSPSTPKQLIPQAALSPPVKAGSPKPPDGAADVKMIPVLRWNAGDYAASHNVYFGTDEEAVRNADASSPEYKGTKDLGSESYETAKLTWYTTYYWRIDEVNNVKPDSPWTGNLWSFTTGDFLVVDDFEDFDIGNNEIWWVWKDGFGYASHPTLPAYAGNKTGSMVGNETTPSYTEETIVHGGWQAMPYFYDNNMQGKSKYSEIELTLDKMRDWTEEGVTQLVLWFHGDAANAPEQMYVKLNGSKVVYDGDVTDITRPRWKQWTIDLASFGVNLQNVTSFSIGFGNDTNPTAGGSGMVLFDDIRLYRQAPEVVVPSEEIWFEAEDADTITAPFQVYTQVPGASGGEYIGTTDDVGNSSSNPPAPDGTATYTFTVAGGTYKISCRIIIPAGDSFWFRVQGATTQTTNHSSGWVRWSDPPDSDVWYWHDVFSAEDDGETVLFTMEPGTYILEVGYREDAALMDAILISKVE
ncbi:MAG TPA: PA14 domain-containing protein [Sedimentisphaerales bacterium]|nr:PA14 domain-containing protein [Sedimentisphaerales bacterium]